MANKFCGNCGTAFDPQTGVCPNCGAVQGGNYDDAPTMISDGPQYGGEYGDAYGRDPYSGNSADGYGSGSYGDNSYDGYSSGGSYGDYSAGGYSGGNPYVTAAKPKSSVLPTVLIVCGAIVVLLVAVVILELTGVIDIFPTKSKQEATPEASREEFSVVSDGVEMSLAGVLVSEDYNGNKIYVLQLDGPREFRPDGKDAETYGSKVTTEKVQIVSDSASAYVNHNVRVNGTQRYRSESAHKYDVIMVDVTFEDYGSGASVTAAATTGNSGNAGSTYTPPPAAAVEILPTGTALPSDMTASTYQPHNGNRYYTPSVANDNDPETCWMAYNPSSHGGDVWIQMSFGKKYRVSGIRFMNGNCWNDVDDVFHLNGRVRQYTISYDNGVIMTGTASDIRGEYTYVTFPTPVDASYINFYVNNTYWGTKYDTVVCLAEIQAIA